VPGARWMASSSSPATYWQTS